VTLRQSTEFSHALSLGAERPADVVLIARFADLIRDDPAAMVTRLLDLHERHHGTRPVLADIPERDCA
jgi:hypothetical protein